MVKKVFFLGALGLVLSASTCNQSSGASTASSSSNLTGEEAYKKYCIACHGSNGKLAFNGAKDLTSSMLSIAERKTLITQGKGLMTPFGEILSEEEIARVAQYSTTFNPDFK